VYCVDRLAEPAPEFYETKKRVGQFGGSIHYRQVDVQDAAGLDASVAEIAQQHQRLDGLVAAAGVQYVSPALEYPSEKIGEVRRLLRLRGTELEHHMLTSTDDGHQLWRCLPISRELLPPDGKVRLRWINRTRWIDECLHRKQRPTHKRVQLFKSGGRPAGPQLGHGMERQGHQSQYPLSREYHDPSKFLYLLSERPILTLPPRW
jgi:hypothetical protein